MNHLDFGDLFSDANAHFKRSVELDDLNASFSSVLLTSAIAKCLDFNHLIYEPRSNVPSFFLVANIRAICEDLMYCALFKRIGQDRSDELAKKLNRLTLVRNVRTQTRFFALNNKLQPTLGGLTTSEKQDGAIEQASEDLKCIWEKAGFTKAKGRVPPSIRQVSYAVGLATTYDYVYYLTSNFVHFNPGQLFRTGWGPMDVGPFSFSVRNLEDYFLNLARFLGGLAFFGYCNLAPNKFELGTANRYADMIAAQLQGNFRWPEITTYEEMNQDWPENVILRSLMTKMREQDSNAMPDVLSELRGLSNLTPEGSDD